MNRPGRGRDEQRAASEASVLDATSELFAQRGPDGVSLRAIGAAAGCTHALIARYYGSKDDLVDAVAARMSELVALAVRRAASSDDPLLELLHLAYPGEPGPRTCPTLAWPHWRRLAWVSRRRSGVTIWGLHWRWESETGSTRRWPTSLASSSRLPPPRERRGRPATTPGRAAAVSDGPRSKGYLRPESHALDEAEVPDLADRLRTVLPFYRVTSPRRRWTAPPRGRCRPAVRWVI